MALPRAGPANLPSLAPSSAGRERAEHLSCRASVTQTPRHAGPDLHNASGVGGRPRWEGLSPMERTDWPVPTAPVQAWHRGPARWRHHPLTVTCGPILLPRAAGSVEETYLSRDAEKETQTRGRVPPSVCSPPVSSWENFPGPGSRRCWGWGQDGHGAMSRGVGSVRGAGRTALAHLPSELGKRDHMRLEVGLGPAGAGAPAPTPSQEPADGSRASPGKSCLGRRSARGHLGKAAPTGAGRQGSRPLHLLLGAGVSVS